MALVPRRLWRLMSPPDQALHTPDDTTDELAREPNPEFLRGQERQQQRLFNNWLNRCMTERKLWSINPRSDKASTIKVGHPDYSIWLPSGKTLLLEMKCEGGRLSDDQCHAIGILSELGHQVEIPTSAYQAINLIKKHL